MKFKIALAGNPNSGKTTLFNELTGSNQFVGNWPGVTVEKKEGKIKGYDGATLVDLPGIYSLSPYTLEEVVARNYLIEERPDAIINIVDGTNLERNLYLTTQLTELGIPVVMAVNMMDVIKKSGDKINTKELSRELGVEIVEISALKGKGIDDIAKAAVEAAKSGKTVPKHTFSGPVEHALAHIEEAAVHDMPMERHRWYAIKIFERDEKVLEKLELSAEVIKHIEEDILAVEKEFDDDSESIITNERYIYIASIINKCFKKKSADKLSTSDKIDRVVTSRILGLPIFAVVMFLVYYISMVTVGAAATDWANEGLFGDGYHLFGIGNSAYEEAVESYGDSDLIISAFAEEYGDEEILTALDMETEEFSIENADVALDNLILLTPENADITYEVEDEETLEVTEMTGTTREDLISAVEEYRSTEYKEAPGAPEAADYGVYVPGIPVLVESGLNKIGVADWLIGLVNDGIVAGVGAVLGFVPQMLVLFLLLAILEACGYMARIAFVLDRVFRKFGLSGKSFIPMLIGVGCSVPGIMASRTIENERDRRMTIMTTSFIPCGAKVPFIAMVAGAIFGGSAWVATSAYFIGMAAVIISGIILKKTRMFSGEPAPFVMELPPYRLPTVKNVLLSMWERGWSFIK
ncbi:MAG: ferrous iron transporter B, partial [Ruminococcaceae bacterium]|nr:ferrous iron transporter B [Oscillospiraceae bacterium]